jgi:hypothetical protein
MKNRPCQNFGGLYIAVVKRLGTFTFMKVLQNKAIEAIRRIPPIPITINRWGEVRFSIRIQNLRLI